VVGDFWGGKPAGRCKLEHYVRHSYEQQKQQKIAENIASKASHLQVVSEDFGHLLREKHDKLVLSQGHLF
jgi:hypothetical protein